METSFTSVLFVFSEIVSSCNFFATFKKLLYFSVCSKLFQPCNADKVRDSLEKHKVSDDFENEESDEERSLSGSMASALGRGRFGSSSSSVSIRAKGILQKSDFLNQLAIPDRREISKMRDWVSYCNDLFTLVQQKGGDHFKEVFEELTQHRDSIRMFSAEYGKDKRMDDAFEQVDCVFEMFQEVLNPLSNSRAVGAKIAALLETQETGSVFGQLNIETYQIYYPSKSKVQNV